MPPNNRTVTSHAGVSAVRPGGKQLSDLPDEIQEMRSPGGRARHLATGGCGSDAWGSRPTRAGVRGSPDGNRRAAQRPTLTYDEGACPGFQEKEIAREAIDLDLSTNRDIQPGRWVRLDDDPHYYFDGWMAEVTILDRTLTTGEVDTVEEYMSSEYGIPLDGPVN